MILYADSSSIVSLHLREGERRAIVAPLLELAEAVVSSEMTFVEVRSALARVHFKANPPRLTGAGYGRAVARFTVDWAEYVHLPVSTAIIEEGGRLAEAHRIRAYDALHLATALHFSKNTPDIIRFSTWDGDLLKAAEAEGLQLAHEGDPP